MRDNGAYGTIARILPMLYPTFPSFKLEELRDSVFVGTVNLSRTRDEDELEEDYAQPRNLNLEADQEARLHLPTAENGPWLVSMMPTRVPGLYPPVHGTSWDRNDQAIKQMG